MNDPLFRFRAEANQRLAELQFDERLRERILAACALEQPAPGVKRWVPISLVSAAALIVFGVGMMLLSSGRMGVADTTALDASAPREQRVILGQSPEAGAAEAGSSAQGDAGEALLAATGAPMLADAGGESGGVEGTDGEYGGGAATFKADDGEMLMTNNGGVTDGGGDDAASGGGASTGTVDGSMYGSDDGTTSATPYDSQNGSENDTAPRSSDSVATDAVTESAQGLSTAAQAKRSSGPSGLAAVPRDTVTGVPVNLVVRGEKGKYGYVDGQGVWVIKPIYDAAAEFDANNRAVVGKLGKDGMRYALIDGSGGILTDFVYIAIEEFVQGEAIALRADGSVCRIGLSGAVVDGEATMATATPAAEMKDKK